MTSDGMTRRGFGAVIGGAAIGGASSFPLIGQALAAPTINIGLQVGALAFMRAEMRTVAASHNLNVEIKDFGDSTSALLAVEQGAIGSANTTAQHLIRAISGKIPVKWVVGYGGGSNVLVAKKDLDLAPGDGKALIALAASRKQAGNRLKIGVPTGSMQHLKLALYLKSLKLDPESSVEIVNIGFVNHPRALGAKEIDMAMALGLFGAMAIEKGDAKLFLHLSGGDFGHQDLGFIVSDKLIKESPEQVQALVNVYFDLMKTFMDNADKRIEMEVKYSHLPERVVAMEERDFLKYNFRTNVADIKKLAANMHDLGWFPKDYGPEVDNYIDLTFLSKASGLSKEELSHW